MRRRSGPTALACGLSALLLACLLASPALAASTPVTYRGTTASGGAVEFDLSADGATVTRFQAAEIPMTCGIAFDGIAEGAYPVIDGAFSNGSPTTGLVFSGGFPAAGLAAGTVSYRIVNVRYDGCSSATLGWTARAPGADAQLLPNSGGEGRPTPPLRPSLLVSYRQEGGIGGPRPSLVVSAHRRARVSLGGCTARFELARGAWARLRAAVRNADIRALSGDYPPPAGSADLITYVVRTRAGAVRIAPGSQLANDAVMRQLRPLLRLLDKMVLAGKHRMAPSCGSSRSRAGDPRGPEHHARRDGTASAGTSWPKV